MAEATRSIRTASGDDVPDIAALLAVATCDTPEAQWLVPDPDLRPAVLTAWYTLQLERALRAGHVDVLGDRKAAAIWLDRTRSTPADGDYVRRLSHRCGRHATAIWRYETLLEQHHSRANHMYLLQFAASDPRTAQILLAHRHRRLDRSLLAAQSTVADLAKLPLLSDAGYLPGEPFRLPDGPTLWPLTRAPQSRTPNPPCSAATRASVTVPQADR